jgi:hypothetical protein
LIEHPATSLCRQVGYQLLQPGVLFLELLELTILVDLQPDVLFLPSIKGLFGNSHPPDQLSERNSRFCLL